MRQGSSGDSRNRSLRLSGLPVRKPLSRTACLSRPTTEQGLTDPPGAGKRGEDRSCTRLPTHRNGLHGAPFLKIRVRPRAVCRLTDHEGIKAIASRHSMGCQIAGGVRGQVASWPLFPALRPDARFRRDPASSGRCNGLSRRTECTVMAVCRVNNRRTQSESCRHASLTWNSLVPSPARPAGPGISSAATGPRCQAGDEIVNRQRHG